MYQPDLKIKKTNKKINLQIYCHHLCCTHQTSDHRELHPTGGEEQDCDKSHFWRGRWPLENDPHHPYSKVCLLILEIWNLEIIWKVYFYGHRHPVLFHYNVSSFSFFSSVISRWWKDLFLQLATDGLWVSMPVRPCWCGLMSDTRYADTVPIIPHMALHKAFGHNTPSLFTATQMSTGESNARCILVLLLSSFYILPVRLPGWEYLAAGVGFAHTDHKRLRGTSDSA